MRDYEELKTRAEDPSRKPQLVSSVRVFSSGPQLGASTRFQNPHTYICVCIYIYIYGGEYARNTSRTASKNMQKCARNTSRTHPQIHRNTQDYEQDIRNTSETTMITSGIHKSNHTYAQLQHSLHIKANQYERLWQYSCATRVLLINSPT